jgi:hypothetical protein
VDERVNPIWKYVAVTVIGVLCGGAPAYVSLAIDQHAAVTRKDVDTEIVMLNAPILVQLTDLKEEVKTLNAKIDETNRIAAEKSK